MKKHVIATDDAPAAVGPYSQGIQCGDYVFTAGQLGIVPGTGDFATPEIRGQTRQALENLGAVLKASGSCLEHVLKVTVFLQDMDEFSQVNEVYAQFFPKDPPARSAVQVAALPLGGRVEIEAVAEACDCEKEKQGCSCC